MMTTANSTPKRRGTQCRGLVSAVILSATLLTTAAEAAPRFGSLKADSDIVQVRHGRNGALAAGAAIGLLGGLAVSGALADDRRGYRYVDDDYSYRARPVYRSRSNVRCDEWGNCYETRRVPNRVWDPYRGRWYYGD